MPYNILSYERRIKYTFPRIEKSIYSKISDLTATAWQTKEPVSFSERFTGIKKEIQPGNNWGNLFDCAWFNFKGVLPEKHDYSNTVLIIDISGEAYIADKNGTPVQGITTVASMYDPSLGFPGKKVVYLNNQLQEDNIIDFWADAGNNDLFGNQKNNGTLIEAYIANVNTQMRDLYYDFEVLNELRGRLPKNKSQYHKITTALYNASLELGDYTFEEAKNAREYLKTELDRKNVDYPLSISAIGHSHIDLAWLWPIRETIRKAARTFSTALMNIDRYPDYIFGASQPQLYQWVKEYYPDLYKKIKSAVLQGRWEPQGAMWVESDTNVTGGEALIRQMLYGKQFYMDEFGFDIKSVWLPDVFGYSAALPQIIKKSGVDYFMTIKISWSEINEFPHHTFIWKGIDGSEVLAHMPPEGTYNSSAAPRAIIDTEEKFKDKEICNECLLLFGIGDGGGGPGEEHLERLKREKNLQSLAPVKQEMSSAFFVRINENRKLYKTWKGELYLEHHRGVYTSEGRSKRYNKLMENLLRDLEIISCLENRKYPKRETETIWKEVLLYQFHDILPGSSIKRVYDESLKRYSELENKTRTLIETITESTSDYSGVCKVYNTQSWDREEWMKFKDDWYYVKLDGMSCAAFRKKSTDDLWGTSLGIISEDSLENDYLKVSFSEKGSISSIYDKINSKEVVKTGLCANTLAIYQDDGDAWDFPYDYGNYTSQFPKLLSYEYYIDGPESIRKNVFSYKNSVIEQHIVLGINSTKIDIRNIIDWKDSNKMLRATFPICVSSDNLTCGIQFGFVERPTHKNTSWDMAKFEVCGQNYVDISNSEYGVAILSDYKYGYSSTDDTIEINLLRSTGYPDVSGDIGIHEFTYSIFPHKGNHITGDVIKKGFELSRPLRAFSVNYDTTNIIKSYMNCNCKNILIETIKSCESGEGIIIRLYESHGINTIAKVSFPKKCDSITEVNLLECEINDSKYNTNRIELNFTPFEIKTLLLKKSD